MYRCTFKHKNVFSNKLVKEVLFNLVSIVEDKIKEEMKVAGYGSIMHDGWSKFGTHYVGIFAQYNNEVSCFIGKVKSTRLQPTNVLLAMRPMCGVPEEGPKNELDVLDSSDDEDKEQKDEYATTFTAEIHANFFREVMQAYDLELEDWAICQVSFSLLNIYFVSYYFPFC